MCYVLVVLSARNPGAEWASSPLHQTPQRAEINDASFATGKEAAVTSSAGTAEQVTTSDHVTVPSGRVLLSLAKLAGKSSEL
jgi:hypothetical protein